MKRLTMTTALAGTAATALTLGLAGCGSGSDSSTVRSYNLTSGAATTTIAGATTALNLGSADGNGPVSLATGGLTINNGGTLEIRAGSSVMSTNLIVAIATAGGGVTSSIIVVGSGAIAVYYCFVHRRTRLFARHW